MALHGSEARRSAAAIHGADADELDRLATEFRQAADELDADGGQLTGLLGNVSWLGDVASRYVGDWAGVQLPQIGLSTRFLRNAAAELALQAREQRAASAASSGAISRALTRPAVVARHLETIRAALDTGGWGVTAADLQKVNTAVAEMTPEERAAVFSQLSDDELRVLKDQMQESRLKGGWSSEEQRDFLSALLPSLHPDDVRRLMGPDWAAVRGTTAFGASRSASDFLGDLAGRTGAGDIGPDEIEIRDLGNGRYIVVLPGVTDLTDGLDRAKASGAGLAGLATRSPLAALGAAAGSVYGEWDGTNQSGSARDMHYARQSEMNSVNGSINGTNGYAFAVKHAMLAAGVPDGSEVMIVGHSFGAYTAAELGADPSFNSMMGSGGYVAVTHVMGLGASAAFRMNDLPAGTRGVLLNNANDAAYIGERVIPTNNADSSREVVFLGGTDGAGHAIGNYSEYARGTGAVAVDDFRTSAYERFGAGGEATRVTVKDPYRLTTDQ